MKVGWNPTVGNVLETTSMFHRLDAFFSWIQSKGKSMAYSSISEALVLMPRMICPQTTLYDEPTISAALASDLGSDATTIGNQTRQRSIRNEIAQPNGDNSCEFRLMKSKSA